jgi:hypothetical protein
MNRELSIIFKPIDSILNTIALKKITSTGAGLKKNKKDKEYITDKKP